MKRKLALLGAVAVLATAGLSGSALATTPDSSPASASGSALATTSGPAPGPALATSGSAPAPSPGSTLAGQPGCEAVAIKLEDGSTVHAVPATPAGEASAASAEPAETVRLEAVAEPAESVRPEALADVPEPAGTVRLDDVEFAEARPALPADGELPALPGKSVAVTCLKR